MLLIYEVLVYCLGYFSNWSEEFMGLNQHILKQLVGMDFQHCKCWFWFWGDCIVNSGLLEEKKLSDVYFAYASYSIIGSATLIQGLLYFATKQISVLHP